MAQHDDPMSDTPVDRLAEKAHGTIDTAHDRARQFASDLSERARAVEDRVDEAAARTADRLRAAAERLRARSSAEGMVASAVGGVASSMEHVGRYLEYDAFARVRGDLEAMIHRNPVRAMLATLAVGYLLARRRRG
jgi:hypothetical protein